ncbi:MULTISPECIES: exodeoxyribonuclease VII large subunit [Gordonibacter]|uniref:Exodeoxyribonuclease 7 large subunit n=1 Tax=Gordonibacter faecis TaxID=3047475 RepID=A0ABT7DI95_9ACTN|nr:MULTISPECIES: exodeoxyribonuclease VII large subunit [unclassified Gordonibacter]MDJ1649240.1 exodeoxyribonuclease VII large subunit [Gordonibacter sp. KGMB12511]HIW76226.1 exodeoxyribonuclease VII large subunit [Candidatus Gordonibacter avicola]
MGERGEGGRANVDAALSRARAATSGTAGGESRDAQTLSVSAAMALAKGALEGVVVRLVGEVSEVSCKPGYKAAYFTVKDKSASLPCMMWNNRYEASGVRLVVGQLVELTGRFTLYAPKGRMNFDVFSLSLAGEGMLRQQVADLARKLEAEGLMRAERKRPLPKLPQCIGLVTSPRGAAVHDVLRTLRRRFPLARVLVAGVPVEGREAPARIVEGIRCVCAAGAEMVLVVRGGGSFEDLMPFNDEGLARAIAACPVPVVTGIGHEPDTSIADMVADLRASTPTAAAEAAAPARESLERFFEARARSLSTCVARSLEREGAALSRLADRPVFCDATLLFAMEAQTLDIYADRLARSLPRALERDGAALAAARARLTHMLPRATERERARVESLRGRLIVRGGEMIAPYRAQTGIAAARLHDLSPLAIIGRGYAVARTEEGAVVKSVDQAPPGAPVVVAVADGELACRVEETRHIETTVLTWEEKA